MEPSIIYCTIRDGGAELHIECRMSDQQKGAFVRVDSEFPKLADHIMKFLNKYRGVMPE